MFATFAAFVLYAVLNGVVSGFDGALDRLGDTRLRVLNRTGPLEPLPIAYGARLSTVENVRKVTHATLLGGYYQDLNQPVSSAGVDLVEFLDVIAEMRVPPDQLDRVLASRSGAVVGSSTANRFGWRLGDRVPIKSAFWINNQSNETWTFEVLAIANSGPDDDKLYADGLFFDYRYLNESRTAQKDTVQHFIVALDDPTRAATVASAIDELFSNSPHQTRTLSEKQWVSSQLSQIEDLRLFVELVVGAVFFSLLFLTGTMMVQAAKARTPEFGILKAMGFGDGAIAMTILAESSPVCLGGAAVGLVVGALSLPVIYEFVGGPVLPLPLGVYASGLAFAIGLSGLISLWPIIHLRRLSVTQAIAGR
ncbi:MAG: ABC transporter permease [Gammaproteobacteria bacterium]|nr:ABC transporter permease [Gammaproteobacteria bacterium]